jgi:hypothetical protein
MNSRWNYFSDPWITKVWKHCWRYFSLAVRKYTKTSGSSFFICVYNSKPSIPDIIISRNTRSYSFGLRLHSANTGSLNVSKSNPARYKAILNIVVISSSSSTNKILFFLLLEDKGHVTSQLYHASSLLWL